MAGCEFALLKVKQFTFEALRLVFLRGKQKSEKPSSDFLCR